MNKIKQVAPKLLVALAAIAIFVYFDNDKVNELDRLPKDIGGTQVAHTLGSTDAPFGYFMYEPQLESKTRKKLPLLVFLHGSGEKGNSTDSLAVLEKLLVHGPCKLIDSSRWQVKYPMYVASPQCHDDWWDAAKLIDFMAYLKTNYPIDETRVYVTGLSMGGYATLDLIAKYGKRSGIAAAVPICGAIRRGEFMTNNRIKNSAGVPLWAFHGNADPVVKMDYIKELVMGIKALDEKNEAKLTVYPAVGHDSWTATYEASGMGTETEDSAPFDQSIYDWMFSYRLN